MTRTGSARVTGIVADLALGRNLSLNFAAENGVIAAAERDAQAQRGW